MMRRYLTVIGAILAVLIGLAIWQKPPPDDMRRSVETELADYGRVHGVADIDLAAGEVGSHDWIVAASHSVKLAGGETFSCFGAYHVTVCQSPD